MPAASACSTPRRVRTEPTVCRKEGIAMERRMTGIVALAALVLAPGMILAQGREVTGKVVRAIGYQRKEVLVNAGTADVLVRLEEDPFRLGDVVVTGQTTTLEKRSATDRKSTRLNSSHGYI